MKVVLLFLLSTLSVVAQAQTPTSEYLASTGGIGPIKIGMSKAAVEKLIGTKLTLPKYSKAYDSYDWDTVKCTYKELEYELVFSKTFYGNDTASRLGVYQIVCRSPLVKTKSGIAIGDNKLKIFQTYEQYRLEYAPDWDKEHFPKRATVSLYDNESSNVLIFYIEEGVVTGFGATIFEGC